jgi:methylene-fatty-acyl-phospholipid synthase
MNIFDIFYWSLLLSPERIFYIVVVNYNPHIITKFFPKNEVRFISKMCLFFKMYQLSIFYLYFITYGIHLNFNLLGTLLILKGQLLNLYCFYLLKEEGIFYGNQYNKQLPWITTFPYNVIQNPQYVGVVISIWGMWFNTTDPYTIPMISSVLYYIGGKVEF